jgi:hypothetical protein
MVTAWASQFVKSAGWHSLTHLMSAVAKHRAALHWYAHMVNAYLCMHKTRGARYSSLVISCGW